MPRSNEPPTNKEMEDMAVEYPETPASLAPHQKDYEPGSWRQYSLEELGNFVHLLAKRAMQRANSQKRDKDLYDAQNYLDMMQAHLNALKGE